MKLLATTIAVVLAAATLSNAQSLQVGPVTLDLGEIIGSTPIQPHPRPVQPRPVQQQPIVINQPQLPSTVPTYVPPRPMVQPIIWNQPFRPVQPAPRWNPVVGGQQTYKYQYDRYGNLITTNQKDLVKNSALDPNRHIVDPGSQTSAFQH